MQAALDLNTALDRPWRRVPWLVGVACALWIALLMGFAHLLEHAPPPMAPPVTLNAEIVELPPAAGHPGGAPAAPAKPKPAPRKIVAHPPPHVVHRAPPKPELALPGQAVAPEETAPAAPGAPASSAETNAPASSNSTEGSGGGLGAGSGQTGAHAIYAPTPVIPPDLREDAFQAVAIAHFVVGADGAVQVTLTQPTSSPRINEVLLETLKQWKFFPATVHGEPIMSQFDLKIPVSIN
jgi:periplasmic protein TonB